ncbi:hypothetical protein [Arthrobacter sp. zg-Y1110]|uniref:hypothetical protein n=1 Tax=Arthrobacter sp. zg-Y1110 TaxID=2886932 RepID=UPI001D14586F|nr:hypothetical protein [Arthrobacter sp. zg-Y1110]MCC3292533.1 hypothetical protein [Arthrobacter sp. zg-Y1110]UWX87035.1 hypothetical protein N2K99_16930 [Arthrobacter sp. zg-Y1110]
MTLLHVPNGYRLAPGADPAEFLGRLALAMNPVRDRLDAEYFIDAAIDSIDRADVYGRPRPAAPLDDAYNAWVKEQESMNRNYVWFDPHSLALRIGQDTATGRHLFIMATDRREYIEALDGFPGIEEYGYQAIIENIPEGVSDKEWAERAEVWTRMLPGGRSDTTMDLWNLREPGDTRTRQVVTALQSSDALALGYNTRTPLRRSRRRAAEKYAEYLSAHQGFEMMPAVMRANRVQLTLLQAVIMHRLAPFSADLLATGSGDTAFHDTNQELWDYLGAREHSSLEAESSLLD